MAGVPVRRFLVASTTDYQRWNAVSSEDIYLSDAIHRIYLDLKLERLNIEQGDDVIIPDSL